MRSKYTLHVVISLGLLVICACYYPGMSGGFLLDDYNTLSPLGWLGTIDSFDKLGEYIYGGNTGPFGRPLSLLTFVANAQTWPADPKPFLITNILIHLLNSVLVFFFVRALLQAAHSSLAEKANFVALISMMIWALHPIQVSTVLYIVQRMTLLACFFTLLSFLLFLKIREAIIQERLMAVLANTLLIFVAALSAVLSKENAVLIPLQLLVIESFILSAGGVRLGSRQKWIRRAFYGGLTAAALIVVCYPLSIAAKEMYLLYFTGQGGEYGRVFTVYERFLTEQRVLGDYLLDILVPKMQSAGVFQDNYPMSLGLFSPSSTLAWMVVHCVLLLSAIWVRKLLPLFFLGICWFYGSHWLESSFVMLEIKFEHRNYLASLGLIIIFAYGISTIRTKQFRYFVVGAVLSVQALLLISATVVWGKPKDAAFIWQEENPESIRAAEFAAYAAYYYHQNNDLALKYLSRAVALSSQDPTSLIKYLAIACSFPSGSELSWSDLAERIRMSPRNWALEDTLEMLLAREREGNCLGFSFSEFSALVEAFRNNKHHSRTYEAVSIDIVEMKAALHFKDRNAAIKIANKRDLLLVPLSFEMTKAGILASSGAVSEAHQRLRDAIDIAKQRSGYYEESAITIRAADEMLTLIHEEILNDQGKEN